MRLKRHRNHGRSSCRKSRKRNPNTITAVRPSGPQRTWRGTPRRTVLSRRIRWAPLYSLIGIYHVTHHVTCRSQRVINDPRDVSRTAGITSSSRSLLKGWWILSDLRSRYDLANLARIVRLIVLDGVSRIRASFLYKEDLKRRFIKSLNIFARHLANGRSERKM